MKLNSASSIADTTTRNGDGCDPDGTDDAALSQQSTAAVQALQAQAELLLASVSVFKINPTRL